MSRKKDQLLRTEVCPYAPELFCAWQMVSDGTYKEIPLTYDERVKCGNAYICSGREAGRAETKRILRTREHKQQRKYTIGFRSTDGRQFVTLRPCRTFGDNDTAGAFAALKEIRNDLQGTDWRVLTSKSVKLDGAGKIIHHTRSNGYLDIDPKQPVIIKVI